MAGALTLAHRRAGRAPQGHAHRGDALRALAIGLASAWSISISATIAVLTALWGLLVSVTSPRAAIAGLLLLATPAAAPRHDRTPQAAREPARAQAGLNQAGAN